MKIDQEELITIKKLKMTTAPYIQCPTIPPPPPPTAPAPTPAQTEEDLRAQLLSCRSALRLQTSRTHQLAAAYASKLNAKETEISNLKRDSDSRLSSIARALIALESSMRREQRAIKTQLIEKDRIISEQQKIIADLMRCSDTSSQSSIQETPETSPKIISQNPTPNTSPATSEKHIHFSKNPVTRPEKPPKPPKPSICTPYRPILKPQLARSKDGTGSRSVPELSLAIPRSLKRSAASEVCLLLAPTARSPTSTHHTHPPAQGETQQKNKSGASPHRVSRMVQRFDGEGGGRHHPARSLSCDNLPSGSALRVVNPHPRAGPARSTEALPDPENIENVPLPYVNTTQNSRENSSSPELYSLSSNEDKTEPKYPPDLIHPTSELISPDPKYPKPEDTLSGNFDEFHLDESDNNSDENENEDILRKEGDGAENLKTALNNKNSSSYEGFLEATGLSQKSILTPSRLAVSNNSHRSVLKPRDVKFRSKANRCFNTGTVKYWSGPYL